MMILKTLKAMNNQGNKWSVLSIIGYIFTNLTSNSALNRILGKFPDVVV